MRLAVCQYLPAISEEESLNLAKIAIAESSAAGAGCVFFGEDFLGSGRPAPTGDSGSILESISNECAANRIAAILGNIAITVGNKKTDRSFVINSTGEILGYQQKLNPYLVDVSNYLKGKTVSEFVISAGSVVLLNGLDAIDPFILNKIEQTNVSVLVLQMNPASGFEVEAIKELALSLSASCADVVVVPNQSPVKQQLSGSFIAYEGAILDEGGSSDIVLADIENKSFIGFKSLREKLSIPGLLVQRFESETIPNLRNIA